MLDEDLLELIKTLAQLDAYILTPHAKRQAVKRSMKDADIKDILLNPERLVRRDTLKSGEVRYKIQGGCKRRKLAVTVNDSIIVITVM